MRSCILLLALLAVLVFSGCGSSIRNDGRRVTNPLDDRTVASPTRWQLPDKGSMLAEPEPPGPGGATDPEGASVRALEYFGELFSVPVRELRVESVLERPGVGGWRVVVGDAFRHTHTVDVTETGAYWVGETRDEGVLVARDLTQRLIVVQARGRPVTLRLPAAGSARVSSVPVGSPIAFAYDAHPRGDGTLVLAELEPRP